MAARDDLLKPIPGSKPGGTNLRYDPVYDKLKEARREEEDVPQGDWERARKVADWPQVIKLASDVLATKSKDLQVAAWLTEAQLRQEGFAGLQTGLTLLAGLLDGFWDSLYPEIEDGDASLRAAPLEWVGRYLAQSAKRVPLNKAGHDFNRYKEARATGSEADAGKDEKKLAARQAAIADGKLTPEDFDKAFMGTPKAYYKQLVTDLGRSAEAVKALDALGSTKFGDEAPSYAPLAQALTDVQEAAQKLLARKLELDPDPVAAAPADSVGAGGGAEASGPMAPEPTSVEDAASRIAASARFLRRADPRNPAPYLLLRGFRWGELRARAGEIDPKLLTAPPTAVRTQLKTLLLDAKWAQLLEVGEEVMATPLGRGWLDLQRYEFTACAQLGTEYDLVAMALRGALVGLLRDVPRLPDLTLMDDTPTANAETRTWLQNGGLLAEAATAAAEAAARPMPVAVGARSGLSSPVFERARDEVRAGRPQKGIELLMRHAEQEKSERARFLCRTEAAGIMVDAELEPVALPMLRELVDEIEAHKLAAWEAGDLVARPLGLLYRCLQKLGGDDELKENLYRQICRLDPLQAMAFPGSGGGGSESDAGGGASAEEGAGDAATGG